MKSNYPAVFTNLFEMQQQQPSAHPSLVVPLNRDMVNSWSQQMKVPFTIDAFVSTLPMPFVIIKFSGPQCGPCKQIAPFYQQLAANSVNVIGCFDLDVEEMKEVALQAGIRSLPTFQCFTQKFSPSGKTEKVSEVMGANNQNLLKMFQDCANWVQQKQTQPQQPPQQVQQPQQTMPAQTPAPLQQQQQQQIRTPTTQGVTIQPYSNPAANTQPQQQQNPFSELLQIRGEMISALNKLNNFLNAHGANSNQ